MNMFNNYTKKALIASLMFGGALQLNAQTARVQVIHNSADDIADSVDVYLNGALLLDNFAYRTATPFIDAPAGMQLSIDVAPKTSTSVANSIYNLTTTLTSGETYILVANGITGLSATSYSPAPAFGLDVFAQGQEAAAMPANTDVLIHHGSTDAPTVDVYENGILNVTASDDITYGDFDGYVALPTDNYVFEVQDMTGSTVVASYDAPLSTLGLTGASLTVLASGFLDPSVNGNGAAFGLYVALPAGGNLIPLPVSQARVQVIHNSADDIADSVDVYLNGNLLLDNFAFRNATPFIDAPAGTTIDIDVAPKTSTSVAQSIYNLNTTLTSGETYIIVADGITGLSATTYTPATPFSLEVFAGGREVSAAAGNTDILIHHGSTDAPTVDIYENGILNVTASDDLAYAAFDGYLELPTDNYVFEVQDMTGSTVVNSYYAPLSSLGLDDSAITVLASGFLDPSVNGNGATFGLYVALPIGGELIPLPVGFLGVNDNEKLDVSMYPNPTNGMMFIDGNDMYNMLISDMTGKVVMQNNAVNGQVDVSGLSNGMYNVVLINGNKVANIKMVKR